MNFEKNNYNVFVFEDEHAMHKFLLAKWYEWSIEAEDEHREFYAALSGGKTPLPFYQKLAEHEKTNLWHKTHLFMVDERYVRSGDHDHNFTNIKNLLINHIDIPRTNIHPVNTGLGGVKQVVNNYNGVLKKYFTENRIDLVLLGIGSDGHTASLFPGSPALEEKNEYVVASSSELLLHKRITMTLPILNRSRNIVFMVSGEEKAHVVNEIINYKNLKYPAAHVRPEKGKIWVLLDKLAAKNIQQDM
jgi:6-phosphogluconolactonase